MKTKYKYYITSILFTTILFSCNSSYILETKYSYKKCNEGIWELSNIEKEILHKNNDRSYNFLNSEKNDKVRYLFKPDSIYYCFYEKKIFDDACFTWWQYYLIIYNPDNKKLVLFDSIIINQILNYEPSNKICLLETNNFYYLHCHIKGSEDIWCDSIVPYCTCVIVINKENPYNANIIRFSNEKVSKIYELKENLYIETAELEPDPSLIGKFINKISPHFSSKGEYILTGKYNSYICNKSLEYKKFEKIE